MTENNWQSIEIHTGYNYEELLNFLCTVPSGFYDVSSVKNEPIANIMDIMAIYGCLKLGHTDFCHLLQIHCVHRDISVEISQWSL